MSLRKWLASLFEFHRLRGIPETVPCPRCEGNGIYEVFVFLNVREVQVKRVCSLCCGRGTI